MDSLGSERNYPIVIGFIGDVLSGDSTGKEYDNHYSQDSISILIDGYIHWSHEEVKTLLKIPIQDALNEFVLEIKKETENIPGAWFQRKVFLELWSR